MNAPSLVGFSLDDVTIGGAEPGCRGCGYRPDHGKAHSGNDSLKVTGRNADWHGVTWDLRNALASGRGGDPMPWRLMSLGVDGETLGYTVNAITTIGWGFRR